MNILILTGKFGMGHWSASQSLRQQLLRAFPGAEVEVLDFVAEAMPNASEAMYKCFNLLVTRGSGLFNLYYKLTQDLPADARPLFETLFLDKLEELVAARRPDAVIATHPLCARMVSRWKGETGSALPLITCVTDLSSHSEWIHKYTDCYLVGSNDIRSRLAAKGVDRDIICVTGIPVRCEFKRPVRRRPGRERNLLIMGGGLGLLPKRDSFYEALDALPGVHTTIITGNNRKLYDRLAGKYAHIEVLGFTDRVYDYMARADRSDAGHRRAVHAPVAPAPGRGELLPPQRAGELRQLAGVRLAGTGRPGRRPWRPAPRFLPLQLEGRRLPSGYPPRLPAPGGGPAQRQGPLLPHLAGGGHHPLPHVSLYPHQGVPLPGIGGGKYHGQAVCRRRAGRAGAPAHPLPPGDPLLAGRRLGSYPAAQGRLIPRRMSSEMTDFHSIPAAAAAGTLRGFPPGKVL